LGPSVLINARWYYCVYLADSIATLQQHALLSDMSIESVKEVILIAEPKLGDRQGDSVSQAAPALPNRGPSLLPENGSWSATRTEEATAAEDEDVRDDIFALSSIQKDSGSRLIWPVGNEPHRERA